MSRIPLPPLPVPPDKTNGPSNLAPHLSNCTVVQIGEEFVTIDARRLQTVKRIGRGRYGEVVLMKHADSELEFAVKLVPLISGDERQWREMDVIQRTNPCPYCVYFYGAMLCEGDIYLVMEKLDISLDKLLIAAGESSCQLPEFFIRQTAFCVLQALYFMKKLDIAHRDIKPSNIVANCSGQIKVCDFGIAGTLENSRMNSFIGDMCYMAPERLKPSVNGYSAKSDLWSLGVTLVELAIGKCPYPKLKILYAYIKEISEGPAPELPAHVFSDPSRDFVCQCVQKEEANRPGFDEMLRHVWLKELDENNGRCLCAQFLSPLLTPQTCEFAL